MMEPSEYKPRTWTQSERDRIVADWLWWWRTATPEERVKCLAQLDDRAVTRLEDGDYLLDTSQPPPPPDLHFAPQDYV